MPSDPPLQDLGPAQDPLEGVVLADRYRLIRRLAQGGMGSVYEGLHQVIGKRVAVKLLHPQMASDPAIVARFLTEARVAAALHHPNLVEALDVGRAPDGTPFLVLEFLEGESLGARLSRVQVVAPAQAVRWLRPVVSALGLAHRLGIVHRDLKPDNLFLVGEADGSERLKVVDFGISKVQEGEGAGVTQTGDVLGTPGFMAPEVLLDSRQADGRSDVFAIGVVLYVCLSGGRPFARTAADRLAEIMAHRPAVPLARRCPQLPPDLTGVVDRCLAEDPAHRFASMDDLGRALDALGPLDEAVSAEDPTPLHRPARPGSAPSSSDPVPAAGLAVLGQSRPALSRSRWARWAMLAALVLAVAGSLEWEVRHRSTEAAKPSQAIGIAPFYGDGAEADTEAVGMRSLIDRAVREALRDEGELGIVTGDGPAPRSEAEARNWARQRGVLAVVWGEALAIRGEAEVEVNVTPADQRSLVPVDLRIAPLRLTLAAQEGLEPRKAKAEEVSRRVADAVAVSLAGRQPSRALAVLDHEPGADARTQLLKSLLLERSNHAPAAVQQAVRNGLVRWPDDAALHERLGLLLLASGDRAGASAEVQRAVSLEPSEAQYHRSAAQVLYALGEEDAGAAQQALAQSLGAGGNLHEGVLARFRSRSERDAADAVAALPVLRQLQAELAREPFFTRPHSEEDASAFLNSRIAWEGDPLITHSPPRAGSLNLSPDIEAQLKAWDNTWPEHYREVDWPQVDLTWLKELHRFGRWDITRDSPLGAVRDLFLPAVPFPSMVGLQRVAKVALMRGMLDGHPEVAADDVEQLAWLAYQTETVIGAAIAAAILRIERRGYDAWVASGHPSGGWAPMSLEHTLALRRVAFGTLGFAAPQVPPELAVSVLGPDAPSIGRCSGLSELGSQAASIRSVADPDFASYQAFADEALSHPGTCSLAAITALRAKRQLPLDRSLLEMVRMGSHDNDEVLDAPADDLAKAFFVLLDPKPSPFAHLLERP